jgi:hypothetical protein
VLACVGFCESNMDSTLQKKIIAMFKEDQKWRVESNNLENGKKSSFDEMTIIRFETAIDLIRTIETVHIPYYSF